MVMRWRFGWRKQRFVPYVVPVISQVSEDVVNNGLLAVYYGGQTFEGYGVYLQEITLVFKDEELRKYKYLNGIYRLIRRLLYGRTVDIETFYVHVSGDKVDYCLFPKIYSGDNDIYADGIHLDTKAPYPKHLIEKWATYDDDMLHEDTFYYLSPYIYVNTSNHAMATHDTNPALQKTLYPLNGVYKKQKSGNLNITVGSLTRSQVEKKYKKWCSCLFIKLLQ
jgi:hypothetical protein